MPVYIPRINGLEDLLDQPTAGYRHHLQQGFQSSGTQLSSASGAFTVTFKTPVALSSNAMKVTLQSTEHKDWAQASFSTLTYHTCILLNSTAVKCWGNNANGQLGDGTTISKSSPVTVVGGITNWSSISCGDLHSAGITSTLF